MNTLLASGGGGTKALEKWAKIVTSVHLAGHPAGPQAIMNMTTSWRNGLGFCAIIHHFRPELLSNEELASRDPADIYGNNELAFNIAEQQLGIPALLDPQDMVECELLDRLSILTYLAQFYQTFHGAIAPGTVDHRKGTAKRTTSSASNSSNNSPSKTPSKAPLLGRKNEPCKVCKKDVYILQRLNVAGKILHRQCFRCARCKSQLSIANYYETENEGTYCCEMCPDEEHVRETEVALTKMTLDRDTKLEVPHSDADEESLDENDGPTEKESKETDSDTSIHKHDTGDESSLPESQQDVEEKLVVTISEDPDGSCGTNSVIHIDTICDSNTSEAITDEHPVETDVGQIAEKADEANDNSQNKDIAHGTLENINNSAPKLRPECDQIDSDENEIKIFAFPTDNDTVITENTVSKENEEGLDNQISQVSSQDCQNDQKLEKKETLNNDDDQLYSKNLSEEPCNFQISNDNTNEDPIEITYPSDMNPFGDEDLQEDVVKPTISLSEIPMSKAEETSTNAQEQVSNNPFGSDFEESEEEAVPELKPISPSAVPPNGPPKPPRTPSIKQSLNPFGSDFEDDEEESNTTPSTIVISSSSRLSHNYSNVSLRSPPSPALSTASRSSYTTNKRKKRPAPPPPSSTLTSKPSPMTRKSINPITSPGDTIKPSNASPTPAPRTSKLSNKSENTGSSYRPPPRPPPPTSITCITPSGDLPKTRKEKDNLNRRSQCMMQMNQGLGDTSNTYHSAIQSSNIGSAGTSDADSSSIMSGSITSTSASTRSASISAITPSSSSINNSGPGPSIVVTPLSPDKSSSEGQWKKKKGPAPPRPVPPKRQVKKIPRKAVNQELKDIETKQIDLEKQGVVLEEQIRELMLKSDAELAEAGLEISNDRDSLGPEVEDAIIQLFDLVNEKNDLFRRQTLLLYMKREQKLEEEHADLEHQIRLLMAKPDSLKTHEDKTREDRLISRLVTVVTQRNEVVDCLEMDRIRALEEDESIETHMEEYAAIKPSEDKDEKVSKKKKKKKEKKKKRKDKSYDADKDVDTKEFPNPGTSEASSASGTPKSSPAKFKAFRSSTLSSSPLAVDKEKAKKLKKKILSSLKPVSSTNKKSEKIKEKN